MIPSVRDFCTECGVLTVIQNKKHWICGECVFKRNHDGKSKEQVYSERAAKRNRTVTKPDLSEKIKKASQLKSISSDKKYRCSDGSLVSQVDIKWKLSITTDKIKQSRLPICQGTGRSDVPLSFSHTISQARCKELGKTELIWDEDNIELEGFEAPTSNPVAAHNIWEVGSIDKKIMLLNFERKLQYIAKHDPEHYTKLLFQIEDYEKRCVDSQI